MFVTRSTVKSTEQGSVFYHSVTELSVRLFFVDIGNLWLRDHCESILTQPYSHRHSVVCDTRRFTRFNTCNNSQRFLKSCRGASQRDLHPINLPSNLFDKTPLDPPHIDSFISCTTIQALYSTDHHDIPRWQWWVGHSQPNHSPNPNLHPNPETHHNPKPSSNPNSYPHPKPNPILNPHPNDTTTD